MTPTDGCVVLLSGVTTEEEREMNEGSKKRKCLVVDALGCGEETVVKEGMEKWLDKFDCEGKNELVGRIG